MTKIHDPVESILSKIDPEKLKEAASGAADEVAKFIKKHPFESVVGALLAGFVIGVLITRKK